MTRIYGTRQVSLYGKANIANTMILSKLWHVIRVVALPKDVLKKLKPIIYQFVMSGMFPPLKANSFFLPRDQGGLGLIDIGAQQHALQFRYFRVLLNENQGVLPDFTYQLLVNALRLSHDVPHHALPLLFPSARYKNTLNGLHPFLSKFNAIDICRQYSPMNINWSNKPSVLTISIVNDNEDLDFLQHASIQASKVQDFFVYNHEQDQFQLKPKAACSKRNTWINIHRALFNQDLVYQPFVHNNSAEEGIHFRSFTNTLVFQQQSILHLLNKEIRFIIQSMTNLDVGRHFNNNFTKKQWRTFYKNTMHYSARNLWYRMIHQQSSNKLAFTQRNLPNADSDRCDLCNEVEDAKHLLISCVRKLDVWGSSFNEFLSSPKSANPHAIYRSIMRFKLDHYLIFSPDHVTIYDIFATIMRMIWRHHYQQFYHFIPFDSLQVCLHIRTEMIRLSNLRHHYD